MSKSVLLKSSLAKKYWMAATGLFLCLFLVGHLLGNLQLITHTGESGRRAFNEYAYFMAHNPFIKVMSWMTYISILFHIIDGILLTIENKKARPIGYAHAAGTKSSTWSSRNMALLGSLILVFIVMHGAHFWYKAKVKHDMLLHKVVVQSPNGPEKSELYITTSGSYLPVQGVKIKNHTEFYEPSVDIKLGEGYKDLHSVVIAFFSGKETNGVPGNDNALLAVVFYVISMVVFAFHLMHGFSSAFQSLGLRHPKYTETIKNVGNGFAILIPLLFAIIPVIIWKLYN
jgi:succinate dehydrogenase / fumarate reductase cytochrome b subunit